jgi:hypothetical protein
MNRHVKGAKKAREGHIRDARAYTLKDGIFYDIIIIDIRNRSTPSLRYETAANT